jgi:multiple sugar transport system substrate-binding protein
LSQFIDARRKAGLSMEDRIQQIREQIVQSGVPVNNMSRRAFVGTALSFLGAATLIGCGASGGGADGGTVTLSQWYHQYGEEGTREAAFRYARQYQEHKSGVKVNVQWIPGDYAGKVNTALLGQKPPDVYEWGGGVSLDFVRNKRVADLTDLYPSTIKEDFNPVSLSALTVENKIYGIKMVDDTGLLYYRKSMLDQANVTPPTTFDELIEAAKKLTAGRVKGLFVGNDSGIGALQDIALYSAGKDNDLIINNTIAFGNERTALAWKKIRELSLSKALLSGSSTDWWDPSAFVQGQVAMQWTGLWAMPAIKKALGDDFGVMPWPKLDDRGMPATFWGGWAALVNPKSKHVDEAKALIKWLWLDNTEIQQDWNLHYGFHVPPRKSAAAKAEVLKSGPAAQAVEYLNSYARTYSPYWTGEMSTAKNDAVSNIVKNGADPMAEVEKAARKCEEQLKKLL